MPSFIPPESYVEQALALSPLEQQIYLSMLGPEVWGLYRAQAGSNSGLLLSVYAVDNTFRTFLENIYWVLLHCAQSDQFNDLGVLADRISSHISNLPVAQQQLFQRQDSLFPAELLNAIYSVDEKSELQLRQIKWVNRVASFILDCLYRDTDDYLNVYREMLATIWFGMCDAALTVPQETAGKHMSVQAVNAAYNRMLEAIS